MIPKFCLALICGCKKCISSHFKNLLEDKTTLFLSLKTKNLLHTCSHFGGIQRYVSFIIYTNLCNICIFLKREITSLKIFSTFKTSAHFIKYGDSKYDIPWQATILLPTTVSVHRIKEYILKESDHGTWHPTMKEIDLNRN